MHKLKLILLLSILFFWASFQFQALAADGHRVGFRTLGFWIPARGVRLDINIWYPGTRANRELNYPPWTIYAARDSKPLSGKFPLILISHPSPATRFSFHDTAYWLASQGFIVACPTHSHDCIDNMQDLFTWEQLTTRVLELRMTLDLVLGEKSLKDNIEDGSIGLVGFGAGATAAILMAGAKPNCISWTDYCAKAGKNDLYCNPWSREKINGICQNFPLKRSLTDSRIKAFVAVSPGSGMLFSSKSFENFNASLLLIAAENDQLYKRAFHIDTIASYLRGKSKLITIQDADMGALMAPCPASLEQELPDLCRSVNSKERDIIHKRLWDALIMFFSTELNVDDSNNINAQKQ
ncbi:MAG: hypothetical protein IJT59_01835 [Desulfovibrionaceae bacterium]|nr:hypothetical protein [Desulfovibrionaceae bacterium]